MKNVQRKLEHFVIMFNFSLFVCSCFVFVVVVVFVCFCELPAELVQVTGPMCTEC